MRYENKNPQFAHQYNKMIVDSLNEMAEAIEEFNSLPWYKKMFYKFEL